MSRPERASGQCATTSLRPISEQKHEEQTRQNRRRVRSDWDSDASTSCGSECAEKCEADQNFVGFLLSSSSESEPLCEMSSEWTPMLEALVVDSGAAETVTPRT